MSIDKKGKYRPFYEGLATEETLQAISSIDFSTSANQSAQIALETTIASNTTPMSVVDAITVTSYDLLAATYSGTTNIQTDYIFDNIELVFTTAVEKTIRILGPLGADMITPYVTTDLSWCPSYNYSYKSGDNLTITVAQTTGACSMNLKLRIRKGTEVLATSISNNNAVRIGSDSTYEYFGVAVPGSAEASAVWKIFRMDTTGNIMWADGNASFDNVWTNYLILNYV